MTCSAPRPSPAAARVRRYARTLRTEGDTPGRRAVAVGLGVFIGCTPFYGLHLALSYLLASIFRVSRLTTYLASNLANPLVAPALVFAEIETGSVVRHGAVHPLTLAALRDASPWTFGADLLVGAAVVGAVLGPVAAAVVYAGLRRRPAADGFDDLVTRVADRYVEASLTACEFARGKLSTDPVYRAALNSEMLPSGDTIVDVGCGQGLMFVLMLEADDAWRAGRWSGDPPPRFTRLIGIEPRPGVARLAALATQGAAEIQQADGRTITLPPSDAVLLFDVLQMLPADDQEQMLRTVLDRLSPGGVVLVREADVDSPRFWMVRSGNRLKAILTGGWRRRVTYRRAVEWMALFEKVGFAASRQDGVPAGPFGNVLFRLTRRPGA